MNPQFPIYIVSKGRHDTRLTSRILETLGVPYFIVVEEQEWSDYAEVIEPRKILILDAAYQRDYDTFDRLGDTKSRGPGPARNFAWDHARAAGYAWHWVMDDNIRAFYRLTNNTKVRVADGTMFAALEDFCLRYRNVAMAGPNYAFFAKQRQKLPPFITNTRIYSCNLIRNDVPFRWRGRYNEDTDLSLRMLKGSWCTVQFNAFLQHKMRTQALAGGNTEAFYEKEGTKAKSKMIVEMHPDVTRLTWRFQRLHHYVDYTGFKSNRLVRKDGVVVGEGANEYGMALVKVAS